MGLLVAAPLVVALAIVSDGARSRAGAIVYGVGLCSMLVASTTYHRWVHTLRARSRWRRVDHIAIFGLIAGTCTALALSSAVTGVAIPVVIGIWLAAATGTVIKLTSFERAERMGPVLYVGMGWSGAVLVPAMWQRGGLLPVAFLFAGGLMYTIGALGFSRQWPTLRPASFSYHEVWHAFTLAAAGLHFVAVASLAT